MYSILSYGISVLAFSQGTEAFNIERYNEYRIFTPDVLFPCAFVCICLFTILELFTPCVLLGVFLPFSAVELVWQTETVKICFYCKKFVFPFLSIVIDRVFFLGGKGYSSLGWHLWFQNSQNQACLALSVSTETLSVFLMIMLLYVT